MTAISSISASSLLDAKRTLEERTVEGAQPLRRRYEFQIIDPGEAGSAIDRNRSTSSGSPSQKTDAADGHVIPIIDYPDPDTTVYDVVTRGRAREQLLDTVRNGMLLQAGTDLDGVSASLSSMGLLGRIMHPAIDVVVHFADGGQIGLKLGNTTALALDLVDTSARDSHGNTIPLLREQLATREWTFDFRGPGNPLDAANLRDQLRFLGVKNEHLSPDAGHYTCKADRGVSSAVCAAL